MSNEPSQPWDGTTGAAHVVSLIRVDHDDGSWSYDGGCHGCDWTFTGQDRLDQHDFEEALRELTTGGAPGATVTYCPPETDALKAGKAHLRETKGAPLS